VEAAAGGGSRRGRGGFAARRTGHVRVTCAPVIDARRPTMRHRRNEPAPRCLSGASAWWHRWWGNLIWPFGSSVAGTVPTWRSPRCLNQRGWWRRRSTGDRCWSSLDTQKTTRWSSSSVATAQRWVVPPSPLTLARSPPQTLVTGAAALAGGCSRGHNGAGARTGRGSGL
jgi:hypothetical protein